MEEASGRPGVHVAAAQKYFVLCAWLLRQGFDDRTPDAAGCASDEHPHIYNDRVSRLCVCL